MAPAHRLAVELSGQGRQWTVATDRLFDIKETKSKSQNYREAV
jgi:hypothetical protein